VTSIAPPAPLGQRHTGQQNNLGAVLCTLCRCQRGRAADAGRHERPLPREGWRRTGRQLGTAAQPHVLCGLHFVMRAVEVRQVRNAVRSAESVRY